MGFYLLIYKMVNRSKDVGIEIGSELFILESPSPLKRLRFIQESEPLNLSFIQ